MSCHLGSPGYPHKCGQGLLGFASEQMVPSQPLLFTLRTPPRSQTPQEPVTQSGHFNSCFLFHMDSNSLETVGTRAYAV